MNSGQEEDLKLKV